MKQPPQVLVEVAVDGVAGAVAAARAGAHRLELCAALGEGGLTPSLGMLAAVLAAVPGVPVLAMLRPRGGDFLYDPDELDVVRRDAGHLLAAGAAGVVFGALRADGSIDTAAVAGVVAAAAGRPVTFHRAFDLCRDARSALAELHRLGVARVLSSGQAAQAPTGSAVLAELVALAPPGLTVIAGAGVRAHNVRALVERTGVREVHLSATTWRASAMQFRRAGVPMGAQLPADEYQRRGTDPAEVAAVVAAVQATGG